MLTLTIYKMGRDKQYPKEWTPEVEANAKELIKRVNALMSELGINNFAITSGWRPAAVNATTAGASKKSNHMIGKAVDIADKSGSLNKLLKNKEDLLAKHELWCEERQGGWQHLQSCPPKSGKRWFSP